MTMDLFIYYQIGLIYMLLIFWLIKMLMGEK